MIDRFEAYLRRARRVASRTEWTARALGLPHFEGPGDEPGLVLVQIDGLGGRQLREALARGTMPFLAHLLAEDSYQVRPMYSGLPSSTPAVQAELYYGVPLAVPGFGYIHRASGRLFRMYERVAATTVEEEVTGERPLLAGGSSYCNIYEGGAADARFCMSSLGWGDILHTAHPAAVPLIAVAYSLDILRGVALVLREIAVAPKGLVAGIRSGQDVRSELKFVQARATIAVMLREIIALGATIDTARGLPIIHLNLLGYDEFAHRRGPMSADAIASLRGIDAVIKRLVRAAGRSPRRRYDVWVFSDHGQETTDPYIETYGRPVRQAVATVLERFGIPCQLDDEPPEGVQAQRIRLLGERVVGVLVPGLDVTSKWHDPASAGVAAMGPLGHVYLPDAVDGPQPSDLAPALVREANIPLVLAPDTGGALAWTAEGSFRMPEDAAAVLGPDHPYLREVADDLVALCHHPDAGELVISGWQPGGRSFSFPHENGSHAGPGPDETDAFVLAPGDAPLHPDGDEPLRPRHLRRAVFATLDGSETPMSRAQPVTGRRGLRVVTYNVHGCVGLDGKLSPERIARVLARLDPDVICLQELDVGRARSGGVDQAALIAGHLEMLLHFHPTISLEEERFGDAVLSRLPMRLVKMGGLPGLGRPELEPRGAVWVEVDLDGSPLAVVNTHLSLHPRERRLQAAALLGDEWLGQVRAGSPAVLCGDFNALPWFPVCRLIRQRLFDCQVGIEGRRPERTWGGRLPVGRIDHVFVDESLAVGGVLVPRNELTRVASDHLPLVVDLTLAPAATNASGPRTISARGPDESTLSDVDQ